MTEDTLAIISIGLWLIVPALVFAGRHWIINRIAGGVKHRFDQEIEKLRAELRTAEARFQSALRERESEIAALRNSALAGNAGRQALLDKRRFEAVEKVWTAVNELGKLKLLSTAMAVLNFKALDAKELNSPGMKQFLAAIGKGVPKPEQLASVATAERPFLPELAWAFFSAYSAILYGNYIRFTLLQIGIPEISNAADEVRKLLKTALPHQSSFVDTHHPNTYHFLLEEIEQLLLAELRKILDGKEAVQGDTERGRLIMEAVKRVHEETQKVQADAEAASALPPVPPSF